MHNRSSRTSVKNPIFNSFFIHVFVHKDRLLTPELHARFLADRFMNWIISVVAHSSLYMFLLVHHFEVLFKGYRSQYISCLEFHINVYIGLPCWLVVPRRNEVAEGGYWITLRPSVRPSVRLSVLSP